MSSRARKDTRDLRQRRRSMVPSCSIGRDLVTGFRCTSAVRLETTLHSRTWSLHPSACAAASSYKAFSPFSLNPSLRRRNFNTLFVHSCASLVSRPAQRSRSRPSLSALDRLSSRPPKRLPSYTVPTHRVLGKPPRLVAARGLGNPHLAGNLDVCVVVKRTILAETGGESLPWLLGRSPDAENACGLADVDEIAT